MALKHTNRQKHLIEMFYNKDQEEDVNFCLYENISPKLIQEIETILKEKKEWEI